MKYMFSANLQDLNKLNATESVTSGGVVEEGAKMDKLTFTNKGGTFDKTLVLLFLFLLFYYFGLTKCNMSFL